MPRLYDIHTHNPYQPGSDNIAVPNLYQQFEHAATLPYCTIGLHPWYLDNAEGQFELLERYVAQPSVLAIGECGLDRVCDTDWELQTTWFARQIDLARQLGKPLIIHCVRAFDEVVAMLEKHGIEVPVIFHGYNKKQETGAKLLANGYYLSFGAAILKPGSPAAGMLAQIPTDRFFLETDDSGRDIADIYKMAATIRKTGHETVILQVEQNFNKVFNK